MNPDLQDEQEAVVLRVHRVSEENKEVQAPQEDLALRDHRDHADQLDLREKLEKEDRLDRQES